MTHDPLTHCDDVLAAQAVRFLLDYVDRRQVYQALLAAINLGNEEIAETIVEHPKYDEISAELSKQRGGFQQCGRLNDDNAQFSEEITPLILASQQNRFEVRSPAHVVQWSNHLGAMCSRA